MLCPSLMLSRDGNGDSYLVHLKSRMILIYWCNDIFLHFASYRAKIICVFLELASVYADWRVNYEHEYAPPSTAVGYKCPASQTCLYQCSLFVSYRGNVHYGTG